ncbi:MAG TPA: hypothetical protein VLX91_00815 [Candidatus Acidoferrales bacterium]|nr:hypothetical protein [Candidatus Acidoferrales bacterium]
MKRIYLLFLIFSVLLVQQGKAQTASLGKSKSSEPCRMASVSQKGKIIPEKPVTDQKSNAPVKSESGSQLDSLTEQMTEAAIKELSRQGRISLEAATRKFIEDNLVQDRDITDTLSAEKHNTATF